MAACCAGPTGEVPAGPGPLLQGCRRCQGGWDPLPTLQPAQEGVASSPVERKHLPLLVWPLPQAGSVFAGCLGQATWQP